MWQKYFHDEDSLVTFFYNNYNTALTNAKKFDEEIKSKAVKVGGNDYAKIVQAATRQAFGGTELVIGPTGEPWLMLKEISSDGNCQTADVIYPHFPIQYYLNPSYIKMLIEPLLFEQESGFFPRKYAMHDLGSNYPRCIGHPSGSEEAMEVEESGNMIILAAAYVKATKDNDFAKKHYKILRQWADYLVQKGLFPGDALTTDDFLGRIKNATNLSLKAIVGLAAMGQISTAANVQSDVTYFNNISKNYSQTWVKYSQDSSKNHTKLGYGMDGSWSMLYNLYPDKLLGTNVIPQSIIDEMDNWYPQVQQKYGVPLLSDKDNKPSHMAKADWTMFQAAVSNTNVKTLLIHLLAKWLDETTSTAPFSDWQDVVSGGSPGFVNRPVIGGVYAPMTLN